MKQLMKNSRQLCLLFAAIFIGTSSLAAYNLNDNTILEITDKYHKVRLGISNTSVYMILDKSSQQLVNSVLHIEHDTEMDYFEDSNANFIPNNYYQLTGNTIEIPLTQIENVIFRNGKLDFKYKSPQSIEFEDVRTEFGTFALSNFYIEDLELFYLTLANHAESTF